jgi:hypothetical protein
MAVAAWVMGGVFVLIWFGTWALQAAIWLRALALRSVSRTAMAQFGLASLAVLAVLDRRQLARIWRNQSVRAENAGLLARERWS